MSHKSDDIKFYNTNINTNYYKTWKVSIYTRKYINIFVPDEKY